MSTEVSNINDSTNTQTSDYDSFINEPPYNFCWNTNNKGVKTPVFPYVISIFGPKSLKASEEKTLRAYLEALIKNWKWKKEVPIIIVADKSGRTGEIVLETIDSVKQSSKRIRHKDANPFFYVRFQDQTELISQHQKKTANNTNSSGQRSINSHLTIIFWQRENNEDSQKSNIDAIKDYLRGLLYRFNDHTLNSILQIQPESQETQNNPYLPVFFYNSRNHYSKNRVKSPSKLIKTLFNKNDLDNLKIINNVSQELKEDVNSNEEHPFRTKDNSTRQLFKISNYYQQLANLCKKKMKLNTNYFCFAFLLISICNALIVYVNSACINSFGASVFQLARYCATGDNYNVFCDKVLTYKYNPIKIQTTISNDVIKSKIENKLKKTYVFFYFFKISKANFICTVFWILIIALLPPLILIIRCTWVHYWSFWHKKYHHCQTLSDYLKILAYLKCAGIKDRICKKTFLSMQVPDWLTAAIIGIYSSIPFDRASFYVKDLKPFKKRIRYLDKRWIKKSADKYRQRINKSGWSALEFISKVGVFLWSVVTLFFIVFFFLSHKYNGGLLWFCFLAFAGTIIFFIICKWLYGLSRPWFKRNNIIKELGQWIRKFDWIKIILLVYIVLSCFGGFYESHRLSKLCSQSQLGCLEQDYIFPFISSVSKNEEFILIRSLIISFVLIAFAFLRMEMFDKERKILFQLLYSFNNAHTNINLLLNPNKKKLLQDITTYRDSYYSDLINKINNCMIQESDIKSILKNINLPTQPTTTTAEPVKKSKVPIYKRIWNFLWSLILFFGKTKEQEPETQQKPEVQQIAAIPDEYIKKIEGELNNLCKNKMSKLQKLKNNEKNNQNDPKIFIVKECQEVLLKLGEEFLTKRIDWLLDVNDRDLKPPK
ncbi:MAG: hypothetical protein IKX40_02140 [Thermoguttaceae bacterium]|nr:hypothetical protein [Thermoguttaceae bacterium]